VSWSMTQCFCAMVLFACGGLALVQMASVILGVIVITIIFAGMCYFLYTLKKSNS
jgi:choline-glycine betaine transporter